MNPEALAATRELQRVLSALPQLRRHSDTTDYPALVKEARVALENGADPNRKGTAGYSAMGILAERFGIMKGAEPFIPLLLRYGANPLQHDRALSSLVDNTQQGQRCPLAELMLGHLLEMEEKHQRIVRTENGGNPLHVVMGMLHRRSGIINMPVTSEGLIWIRQQDHDGNTPAHVPWTQDLMGDHNFLSDKHWTMEFRAKWKAYRKFGLAAAEDIRNHQGQSPLEAAIAALEEGCRRTNTKPDEVSAEVWTEKQRLKLDRETPAVLVRARKPGRL